MPEKEREFSKAMLGEEEGPQERLFRDRIVSAPSQQRKGAEEGGMQGVDQQASM